MNTEDFQRSVQEADNNTLRIGAANRIVQKLDELRYSNNENSAKRWVWELCQNAKDICNTTGKVKVSIDFDEENRKVCFKHNGKAFSMTNIMSLINQASSKDRNDGSEKKSGKFGTGFLTTHLLSEIVNISGVIETVKDSYSEFRITLDRTGSNQKEIVEALEKAVRQLGECRQVSNETLDWNNYNTVFEYELTDEGIEVAKQGLDNLKVSAPFVLSMLRDIEEIKLETTEEVFRYRTQHDSRLDCASVHVIRYESRIENKSIYILNLIEDGVTISTELKYQKGFVNILPFEKGQSKLFCDFPLIGTEDFPFPVVVSSSEFNPTEPRDGIYLTCKSKSQIDEKVRQNRSIIEKACHLYEKLLRYAAERGWKGIYNITRIEVFSSKQWYDMDWLQELVDKCKMIILHAPMIITAVNTRMELKSFSDEVQVFVIADSDEERREKIWELLSIIMPERIPAKDEVHNWYRSLWSGCNRYTFRSLTEQLQSYETIDNLQAALKGGTWQEWLTKYYDVIEKSMKLQEDISGSKIKIIPNQRGVFHAISTLCFDKDILEEYKDILFRLGVEIRRWLIHKDITNREWFDVKEVGNKQVLKLIEEHIEETDKEQRNITLLQMVYLYTNKDDKLFRKQKEICAYAGNILRIDSQLREVDIVSDKLLQEALKYTITCVADRISEQINIENFAHYMEKSCDETVNILTEFIEFVVKAGYENLINKSTRPILPNQNGTFIIKDDIFLDKEMDDTLKGLAVSAGYDIKAELLMKQIYLQLPENREKKDSDVSQIITQYVNEHRASKEESVRRNFRTLLLWITDHDEKAAQIFPELYHHKHYLYDDEEITENIRQAETFQNIMGKYSIGSVERLEEIIKKSQENVQVLVDTREEITQEVLLQYGIDSEDILEKAFKDDDFAEKFSRPSKHDPDRYKYVKHILERSKNNIFSYLENREEYDISDAQPVSNTNTIFVIKKNGKEIYLLARPSDGGEVRIFYETEKDILDYSMDWELWVENDHSEPQKLTFGKIIKLSGLNRIPLKGM